MSKAEGPEFFFGYLGVSCALVFASKNINKDLGAAYGTAKSGVGIVSMGVLKPDLIMKSIIPVVNNVNKGYGRYIGYIWNDCCCYSFLKH